VEEEKDNSMAFLDTKTTRNPNGAKNLALTGKPHTLTTLLNTNAQ